MVSNAKYFFFLFFLLSNLSSGQGMQVTLTDIITAALKKDYNLANRQLDVEMTILDRKKLGEAFLPKVEFGAKDAYLLSSYFIDSPGLSIPSLNVEIAEGNNKFTTRSNLLEAELGISALLFSGGKITHLRRVLTEKQKALSFLLEKDRQELISEIISAYDQLALLRQIQIVLEESEKRLATDMRTADKALGYGLITKYEHQKIEVAQAQLKARQLDYRGKLEIVLEYLWLMTDIDKAKLSAITPELSPVNTQTNDLSVSNRPELQASEAVVAASDHKIKAEKTWIVPKLQAVTSLKYLGISNGHIKSRDAVIEGGEPLDRSMPGFDVFPMFSAGIGLKWDIFDANEGRREVQRAQMEKNKVQNDKNELTDKLELNLVRKQSDYQVALSSMEVGKSRRQTAFNALTQATSEYKTGLIKSSQLIEAEEDFQASALAYIQSIFNQRRAAIALLQATGKLSADSITE
ncbi:TolC family protein [Flavobacterium sp.]|uniref:TolC family protein n=1 Tax=Flavobacterium sp. TaxID=239 RepID=UPI0039E33FE2